MNSEVLLQENCPIFWFSSGLYWCCEVAMHVEECENHVRELRTFFTVVLEPNIHTFSVLSETLQDFLKSKLC